MTRLKISAVHEVFSRHTIIPVSTKSGVSEQPIGKDQIQTGAKNRAEGALERYPEAMMAVGIESGLVFETSAWFDFTCVVCIIGKKQITEWSKGLMVPAEWVDEKDQSVSYPPLPSGKGPHCGCSRLLRLGMPEKKSRPLARPETYRISWKSIDMLCLFASAIGTMQSNQEVEHESGQGY